MNQAFYLLAATEPETYERLFGLDPQLIFDSLITGLSVFILFCIFFPLDNMLHFFKILFIKAFFPFALII